MRKTLVREVTSTTLKIAQLQMVDGKPEAVELPTLVLVGNVSPEKAQKEVEKLHGKGVQIFEITAETNVYELPIEEFIKHASIKVVSEDQE